MQGRPRAASGSLPAAAAGPPASLLGRRRTRSEAEHGQSGSQQRPEAVAPPTTAAQSFANSGASSPRTLMDPASAPMLAFTPGMRRLLQTVPPSLGALQHAHFSKQPFACASLSHASEIKTRNAIVGCHSSPDH